MSVGKKAHRSRKPRKREKPGGRVRDPIPVEPVRQVVLTAMQERGLTWGDVALLAGQDRGGLRQGKGDTSWVQRRLGLMPESVRYRNGRAFRSQPHEVINKDVAVSLVRAVGEFPCDVRDPQTGESIL